METFSFSIPQNVVFGAGSLLRLPELAVKAGGKKAYIISGPHLHKIGMVEKCTGDLREAGIESEAFTEAG
ncbi:iron-containing alcohol dehydrogenase [Oribacterium sp. WCC10]|uniref:iron-containing alcohol dehydrogenase n=1 Tax=Oribacterium sp. WCC10 TaxID=1855343 RepID=UPI0008EA22BF|nr:iron-containing alcohol dehydrogenase [Oribacterium sp. WCC10]SFG21807.1 alcohol dehydrogenase [Oribacterium sp. WCC10]